jgi:hypothetical protein
MFKAKIFLYRFLTYLKLFLGMGILWIFEIISGLVDDKAGEESWLVFIYSSRTPKRNTQRGCCAPFTLWAILGSRNLYSQRLLNNHADPTEYSSAVGLFHMKIQVYLVTYLFENVKEVKVSKLQKQIFVFI